MGELHTLYEWCLVNNVRPLGPLDIDRYMLKEITLSEFKYFLDNSPHKENSTPRKPNKFLERRMYGFVPYNISKIQQGIQFNHANDDYSILFEGDEEYKWFKEEWKTNIILNGGTSNEGHMVKQGFKEVLYKGTMQQHLDDLIANGIKVGTFYEPDLNSMLSAIVFLVDERVFDRELYPDFIPSPSGMEISLDGSSIITKTTNEEQYNNWLEKIGGPTNEFLRTFLSDKKLA